MLHVSLLGEQAITDDRAGGVRARSSRTVVLVAFLVSHAGSPQPRQHIAGLFWPESTDAQALTNLRRELHHLRQVLGDQVEDGHLPTWAHIRGALAATWLMVSASFAPLLAVVIARLVGASTLVAANAGLVVAVVLLAAHGWTAGRASKLRGRQLLLTTSLAIGLGLLMIALKDLVLLNLH